LSNLFSYRKCDGFAIVFYLDIDTNNDPNVGSKYLIQIVVFSEKNAGVDHLVFAWNQFQSGSFSFKLYYSF